MNGLRASTGSSWSILPVTVCDMVVVLNSTWTTEASTLTVSVTPPTFRVMFTVTSPRVSTDTFSCWKVLKPAASAVTT